VNGRQEGGGKNISHSKLRTRQGHTRVMSPNDGKHFEPSNLLQPSTLTTWHLNFYSILLKCGRFAVNAFKTFMQMKEHNIYANEKIHV
jgi:hypothetical protein